MREAELALRELEGISPQPRLEVRLELREVEVRPAAALQLLARVATPCGGRSRRARPRPARRRPARGARAGASRAAGSAASRSPRSGGTLLSAVSSEISRRTASVDVPLALDDVLPRRRVGVLVVGHEDAGARVERVDHHLAVDRAGDLDSGGRGRSAGASATRHPASRGRPPSPGQEARRARPRRAPPAARAAARAARDAGDSARGGAARRGRAPRA